MSTNSRSSGQTKSVLLVDDNEAGLRARKAVLSQLGYSVQTASSLQEAKEKAKSGQYAAVVTDYRMPDGTGSDVIAALRPVQPKAVFVLLSGFTDAMGLTEKNTGADLVLAKSANEVTMLQRSLHRMLSGKKAPASQSATLKKRASNEQ